MSPELLSPAGNYESMLAAINAGCDAIYAGTDRFSARAYAGNLSVPEFIQGIKYAHLCGVKVYLTLNTLIFESEFEDAIQLIGQLYEYGLDGIIMQDTGLILPVKECFPDLLLHASTQMSIMNEAGALGLKNLGFSRVVPARELDLDEIRQIKDHTGIEMECFIHGAMCYSYSGLCLMSSMIGDRSGNRGRCAGTCRLPFCAFGKNNADEYPLSMKDLCAVNLIPDLIDAGIDSFKIEGRMKSPEYVAGVTDIYRRAIDRYLESGRSWPGVSKGDMKALRSLYIRTEVSEGYLNKASGRDLITFDQPGYNGSDEECINRINKEFVHDINGFPVTITAYVHKDEAMRFTFAYGDICAEVTAGIPEPALKAPLSADSIKDRLSKLGNTCFIADEVSVDLYGDVFIPVKELNDIRRSGINKLESMIIYANGFDDEHRADKAPSEDKITEKLDDLKEMTKRAGSFADFLTLDISVHTKEQLEAVLEFAGDSNGSAERIIIDYPLYLDMDTDLSDRLTDSGFEVILSLPAVFRERSMKLFDTIADRIRTDSGISINGVLVHTLDELYFIADRFPEMKIITGTHVYAANSYAYSFLKEKADTVFMPYESDLKNISATLTDANAEVVIYGYIPMMISAGCIKNTYGKCDHVSSYEKPVGLTDRKNKRFFVYTDCLTCTNIIYNCVPLSLHNYQDKLMRSGIDRACINFTIEDASVVKNVLGAYLDNDPDRIDEIASMDHTTGHIKRRLL